MTGYSLIVNFVRKNFSTLYLDIYNYDVYRMNGTKILIVKQWIGGERDREEEDRETQRERDRESQLSRFVPI